MRVYNARLGLWRTLGSAEPHGSRIDFAGRVLEESRRKGCVRSRWVARAFSDLPDGLGLAPAYPAPEE